MRMETSLGSASSADVLAESDITVNANATTISIYSVPILQHAFGVGDDGVSHPVSRTWPEKRHHNHSYRVPVQCMSM